MSDHWECLSVTHWLLFSKLDWCDPCVWRCLLQTRVVTFAGVGDEDCVGNSLLLIWKLRFGHKAKLLFKLWAQGLIYYECGHSHGPLLSNIVGNQSEINFLITCLFSISIYRYILASPGGMQSPFLRLGLSPAATATARWRNRASIAIYPWKQDQYISWSEIVFTYCGVITNVQATSESVCYLSFWRDKLTSGLHRRYSVFLWYFIPMLKNVQGALLPET